MNGAMLDGDAVSKVAGLAKDAAEAQLHVTEIEIDGAAVPVSTKQLFDLRRLQVENWPGPIPFSTLMGLVGYVESQADDLPLDRCMAIIGDGSVRLVGPVIGPPQHRDRFVYAVAEAPNRLAEAETGLRFALNREIPLETMRIGMLALFEDTPERSDVIRLLSKVRTTATVLDTDDGKSQRVEVVRGLDLTDEIEIPNPISLAPYRTFVEIEQPPSLFVLRVGNGPQGFHARLQEADGGAWKLDAARRIRDFLEHTSLAGQVSLVG